MRRIALMAVLVCALILPACSSDKSPVNIAAHVWPGYEFLFLGQNLNFIPQRTLTLTETASATDSIASLHQDNVNGAALTLDEVLLARSQGIDLRIILIMDISVGADKIVARENIGSVNELRGKTIAVEDSAVGKLLLAQALDKHSLALTDVDILPAPAEQHLALWQSGKADALVTYEPKATLILNRGGHVIFDSSQVPETIVDVLAVKDDVIRDKPDMLHQLVSGFFKAQRHFFTNPQDAAYRMSAHLNVPSQEVRYLYKGLELPGIEHNLQLLNPTNPHLTSVARDILSLELFAHTGSDSLTDALYTDEFLQ